MDPVEWAQYGSNSTSSQSQALYTTSPETSQYESAVHSPEQSLPDSLDHMDLTGSWHDHSGVSELADTSSQLFSVTSPLSSGSLHCTTSSSLPLSSTTRTFSLARTDSDSPIIPFRKTPRVFKETARSSLVEPGLSDLELRDLTMHNYLPSSMISSAENFLQSAPAFNQRYVPYPWSAHGLSAQYEPVFRQQEPFMPYHATPMTSVTHPESINPSSSLSMHPSTFNHIGSSIPMHPVKPERSYSQSSHGSHNEFGSLHSHLCSSHQDYAVSNTATFGSSTTSSQQGEGVSLSSDDSYVVVPSSPSRAGSNSPVMVDMNLSSQESPSSPDSASSHSKHSFPQKTKRRRSPKVNDVKELGSFLEISFDDKHSSRKSQSKDAKNRKIGGRQKGSHLDAQTAEHARKMRSLGSCWICICQREKVYLATSEAAANQANYL
jgi:hypothetical protein